MKRLREFLRGLVLLALMAGVLGLAPETVRAGPYRDYALSLNASLPAGAKFRPDLEVILAQLANGYRATQGRSGLKADSMFLQAARAHAADMMLHNLMGHAASTGHGFDSRMRAFVDDITRFPAMAENAARDSQKTPADKAKARSLFQQWVDSRPHRKALVSRDYAFVSTGVVQRGNMIWAVQIFWAKPREKGMFSQ